ncbi:hypothetical protein LQT97_14970 [Brucella pseudogrignonensis]|uniref:hypothetical protein n=1 Tax=Brucella pseudogrignonensis TaxID=419475 RepID=UPI001E51CF8F|nr:hypothetical protein [Brucella pseudogrignonensis]MCD4512527.1 hypothetical protein [Brucella pseudogrignonensis]
MASKELIEKVARAFEREDMKDYGWSEEQFDIWWDHDARNRNKPRQYKRASLAISTILAALQEPTEAMEFAVDPDDCPTPDAAVYTWRKMLNTSPLGEKAE